MGLMLAALLLIRCGGGNEEKSTTTSGSLSALQTSTLTDLRQELLTRKVFNSLGKYTYAMGGPAGPGANGRADLQAFSDEEILAGYRNRLLNGNLLDIQDTAIIYGVDTRIEIDDVVDPVVRAQALGVAALIPKKLLKRQPNGSFQLTIKGIYHNYYHLCTDMNEAFVDQPVCADCSSFAVSANTVITAGHCIHDQGDAGLFYLVFDYRLGKNG